VLKITLMKRFLQIYPTQTYMQKKKIREMKLQGRREVVYNDKCYNLYSSPSVSWESPVSTVNMLQAE
jgi:hypothetical protein